VRGVEIAIADKKQGFGHMIELVKADDQCTEAGGRKGASDLAADPQITGVIGTTCSVLPSPRRQS
jgi:ABC-type branched-subunit amino acid transport system substrate-binding protein